MSEGYSDIKNYSFQKDIGEGNFGKVKLGIYKPTGEEFTIKVLNKDKIKIKMKNSIFKENQIITKFNHINVIYVFKILEDKENFYIIMEYCKHGELFDYIVKNEKLSEEEASIFFYQLINGIEHIHSKGISHRDLKPENLLLDENNILKIIDFGLSHEFFGEGDELLKTKCGSPSYAAPEIICCPFYDGFKVDVWCSGIILYAMLCGYLPFEGDDNDTLFKNILECDPEFPEFLSDISKDIIIKILKPDPEKRITIEDIKKHNFYLMGKILCTIDYDTIENNIIKRRNIIFKNAGKNSNYSNDNKSNDIITINITRNNNFNTINSNSEDTKNIVNDKNYDNNINIKNTENKCLNLAKKKINDINVKCNKTIDLTNKPQQILKTDINDNIKISSKKIKNTSSNKNKNIKTISNNNEKNKLKTLNFIDFIKDEKNNKKNKKDSSLMKKILDLTNNNFLKLYKKYEKTGLNKYNTNKTNLNKMNYPNKNRISNNKSKTKNSNSIKSNNNNDIKPLDNNQLISLSNDNYKNTQTNNNNNNKKHHKFNLFKETLKNKNKGKHRFSIIKALSNYEKNENKKNPNSPYITKKNSMQSNSNSNSINRTNKHKEINLIVPNSTLYYNNINININELNINSKSSENKNSHVFSSLVNNKKIKCLSKAKTNNNYINNFNNNYKSLENNNYKYNKTISAKRLLSYNNKHNKKNNNNNHINIKTDINSINSNGNIYTISNDYNHHNHFINTIINNENNVNNLRNFRNKKYSKNKKYKSLSKPERILSTEPKEALKFRKQFSFDKANTCTNNKKNEIEVNLKKRKSDKRSKSERANKFRTINTEAGKNTLYNKHSHKKSYINKKNTNKLKYDINKIDELFLHKFMEEKYNKKKNNKDNIK